MRVLPSGVAKRLRCWGARAGLLGGVVVATGCRWSSEASGHAHEGVIHCAQDRGISTARMEDAYDLLCLYRAERHAEASTLLLELTPRLIACGVPCASTVHGLVLATGQERAEPVGKAYRFFVDASEDDPLAAFISSAFKVHGVAGGPNMHAAGVHLRRSLRLARKHGLAVMAAASLAWLSLLESGDHLKEIPHPRALLTPLFFRSPLYMEWERDFLRSQWGVKGRAPGPPPPPESFPLPDWAGDDIE